MYVCVDVTHPSEVEEAPALRREVLRAGAGPEAAGGFSGKEKGGGRGGRPGGPGAPGLGGLAWAAPSPVQAGSRAPVGAAPALPLCGFTLGAVWGPPRPTRVGQSQLQHTAARPGRGWGRRASGAAGHILSVWRATFARRQWHSRTRSRLSPQSGSPLWTVPPPGGWREPCRAGSRLQPEMPSRLPEWVAAA